MSYHSEIQADAPVCFRSVKRIHGLWSSPGIEPHLGAVLFQRDEEDSDGFWLTSYYARLPDRDVWLNVSRFDFTPTQARFDWLARNGFPNRGFAPWSDAAIDEAIAREAAHV